MEKSGPNPVAACSRVQLRVINESLATPMIEILVLDQVAFETQDGVVWILPAKTELYLPPGALGYGFFKSLQEVVAEVQAEEESRWLRMTEEQVASARADYIPF